MKALVRSISIDQEISATSMKHFEQTNRMIDRYGSDSFIIFDFSRKVEEATVRRILRGGLTINGEEYQFIGCSSSGLKERTCYMFKGSRADVNLVLEECGSFSFIKSRYKRLKRIGLLFSSASPTRIEVPDDKVVEVPDIETSDGNFTDGCGAVSQALAEQLRESLRESCRLTDDNYHPSVFQIRYQGCKGVVMVDPKRKETEQLVIRPSMKKFNPGRKPFRELWLCDHSRPYTFGHLNRQFITLLSCLGVKDEVFLCIQKEHFQRLQNIHHSPEAAFEMLMLDNQQELAMLCTTIESLKRCSPQLSQVKTKFVSKLEKLRLPVMKSRNVFGVCDPTGKLHYGQCFFRYTEHGKSKTLQGKVVVAKNPCYLLGDVRVLTAIGVEELNYLVDCIVFPTQGERPHPSEIAGSDLDGDQYFVCWDEGLIVPRVESPYSYPSEDAHETSENVTMEILIDYFASQRNNMGKIDSYYKYWANKEGAGSPKCQTLGKLFSRSVDATKTGDAVRIPRHLKPPSVEDSTTDSPGQENGSAEACLHIWETMEKQAKEMKQTLSEDIVQRADASTMSEEFIWSLLEDKVPNLTEFQLLQLIQNWCSHHSSSEDECCQKLLEFARQINFGEFTVDQQTIAVDCGIPLKTVTNALNWSKLLPKTLLEKFLLSDPHRCWRFYFNSTSAEFNWKYLLRGLQSHPESMIIIKVPDEVTFVLHFLSPPQEGETDLNIGSVVAYFSSKHFDLDLQCVLGSDFKLILNEETLQLFRGHKSATFIWLSSQQQGRQRLENSPSRQSLDSDTVFDRISVDLTRFKRTVLQANQHPKVNKQSVLSIEMFVKSHNFQPAYMDIIEADLQEDYPIEEASIADDIEDLPSDPEEDCEEDTPINIPDPCSTDAAFALLTQFAQKGCYHSFQKILESLLSKNGRDIPNLVPPFHQLLETIVNTYCHRPLSDEAVHCLQIIITSLYPFVHTPMDLLTFFSYTGRLGLASFIEQITDHMLPNIHATQSSEYIDVIGKWKLWYYLPSDVAVRLSQHFYTLYSSLCDRTPIPSNKSTSVQDISSPENELVHLASSVHHIGSPEQLQIDRYVNHFSHLILNHLLCEIFASKDLGKKTCDTSSSLVRMSCCEHKHPQSSPLEADTNDDGTKSSRSCIIVFNRPTQDIASKNFTIGCYVAISQMKKQSSPPAVVFIPVAIGRIVKASRYPANIEIEVAEPVPLCLKRSARCERGHWQLVLVGNITSFDRSLKALRILREPPGCTALLPLIVSSYHAMSGIDTQESIKSENASQTSTAADSTITVEQFAAKPKTPLNSSQQKALNSSLKQRLTLIHGPPGTGKTHVACEIVQQQLIKDEEHNPILVVAETNLAVDNLCEKLMSLGVRVVRIGKLDHIAPPVRSISLEGQIEKKRVEEGKDKAKSPFPSKRTVKSILSAAQVVAATCTSAGDPILKGTKLPFVIIDEATQVTEPTSLIPLVYGCQQLVLIGDPEQLAPNPPVTSLELQVAELSVTLFHRLQRILPSIFLSEQHRMHPELAKFPSCKFYRERLLTATSRCQQKSAFQEEVPILERDKPLVFVKVGEREKRIGTSFCNPGEAEAVAKIINYLIEHKVSVQQIDVLTPYKGQVKCIQEECQKQKIHNPRVRTIDSFQGREADVIIFSTVRCNSQGELGFTSDRYRMNVLLTRAKHGLIGIGCENTLSKGSPLWKEWLESVKVIENIHEISESHKGGEGRSDFRDSRPGRGARVGRRHGGTRPHSRQVSRGGPYHTGSGIAEDRPTSTASVRGQERAGNSEGAQGYDHNQTQRGGYLYGRRGQRRGRSGSYYSHRGGGGGTETVTQHWSSSEVSPHARQGNRGGWRGREGGPSNYRLRGHRYHQRSRGDTLL